MLKKVAGVTAVALLTAGAAAPGAQVDGTVIVTSSNTADNHLRVYDTAGTLIQEVPTLGQGGAGGNAGGIATTNGIVAVVNFGSQTVSLFARGEEGFDLRQTVPTNSQPVSVAFGKTHLYVLGTTTVESHRIGPDGVEAPADGTAGLLIADGSAAQVGVAGDELIVTEKSGAIERVQLREGAVFGTPVAVALSEGQSNTPFGLTTRGSNAYPRWIRATRALLDRRRRAVPVHHEFTQPQRLAADRRRSEYPSRRPCCRANNRSAHRRGRGRRPARPRGNWRRRVTPDTVPH
jgi:hypothetical protein